MSTDLVAAIFMTETAEDPVFFCSDMHECKDGGMDGK